ncbi:hypothetical protein [Streptosporangium sp. CA-115845]|uniref:hypothetical protein n=1 Tax=Streptosporangium sp. CA-115845 TaxID=3240071 RepID=UPI003D947FCF
MRRHLHAEWTKLCTTRGRRGRSLGASMIVSEYAGGLVPRCRPATAWWRAR